MNGIRTSKEMPERKAVINLAFYCNIREVIPDFKKLNFEHKNNINIWMTTFGGLVRAHGFQNWAEIRPINEFSNFR